MRRGKITGFSAAVNASHGRGTHSIHEVRSPTRHRHQAHRFFVRETYIEVISFSIFIFGGKICQSLCFGLEVLSVIRARNGKLAAEASHVLPNRTQEESPCKIFAPIMFRADPLHSCWRRVDCSVFVCSLTSSFVPSSLPLALCHFVMRKCLLLLLSMLMW